MVFNEANVNRDSIGRFGEKTGWPPEITLDATVGLSGISQVKVARGLESMDSGRRRAAASNWLRSIPGPPMSVGQAEGVGDELANTIEMQGIAGKVRTVDEHPTDPNLEVFDVVLAREGFYGPTSSGFTVVAPKGSQLTTSYVLQQALSRDSSLPEHAALNETAFSLLYSSEEVGEERTMRNAHTYDTFHNAEPVSRRIEEVEPGVTIDFGIDQPGIVARVDKVGSSLKVHSHDGRALTFMADSPVDTFSPPTLNQNL